VIVGLIIVLGLIFVLPFVFQKVEHNLEAFLMTMGLAATIISGTLSINLMVEILENKLLYFITAAVLIAGLIFRVSVDKIKKMVHYATVRMPLPLFIFLLIVFLGLISSVITAIITALILVEIVHALSFSHERKVKLTIITCFSIGLGAALTPLGEPLATIVVSSLNVDFFYLLRNIGVYVIPCIIVLGIIGAVSVRKEKVESEANETILDAAKEEDKIVEVESLKEVIIRSVKVFIFVISLELLGAGFKPLIDTYVIHLHSAILYWINMSSAVLDNATLAAAEISPAMTVKQIQAILMGLLISGGMLIPGNIPNIISAGKLNIKSREWAKTGVPLGLVLLVIIFVFIFIFA
jgi:Predicted cation transporter